MLGVETLRDLTSTKKVFPPAFLRETQGRQLRGRLPVILEVMQTWMY
jgi:hypothetical protein